MAIPPDDEWTLTTDYDGCVMCEACDEDGLLFGPPQCWGFTVKQLLETIAAHRKVCRKRTDAR